MSERERYVLTTVSEDGEVRVDIMSRDLLLKRLNERYYGAIEFFSGDPPPDPMTWGGKVLLVLSGGIVVPKPQAVVTSWTV